MALTAHQVRPIGEKENGALRQLRVDLGEGSVAKVDCLLADKDAKIDELVQTSHGSAARCCAGRRNHEVVLYL